MIITIHKASVSVPIGLEFQGYNTFYTCDNPPVATSAAAVRPVEKPVETPVAKSEGHAAVGALEIVNAFCAHSRSVPCNGHRMRVNIKTLVLVH